MKVFVVTRGEYSFYHIVAVKTNRDEAEMIASLYGEYANVEEYDTDDIKITWRPGSKYFDCDLNKDGSIEVEVDRWSSESEIPASDEVWESFTGNRLSTKIIAEDEEHAKKIAADRFAQYRAMKEGL